ncbi:uncharacterized protein PV09_02663 [Verruconis gallopava]|uniref:2'-phosphotransferase n=1 Tax=Verruconis gallopava TaxID=253628 RepID=A0A0D2AHX2_9PEZI|nr:uncharacterized protein PV09_02663 [Verruconis gallopava]KIW06180.1 hypothetical protein PV09_02663 [Verruconis gallopava]
MPGNAGRSDRSGRRGGPKSREEQISRALSKLLRHQAEKEGLVLGPGGYINLQEVINNRNIRSLKVTVPEIKAIVANNDKQRFKLIPVAEAKSSQCDDYVDTASKADCENDDPSQWLIRANQGHSIKVDEEGLMEPITLDGEIPSIVVHGTTSKAWPLILSSGGLKKMSRNHIHFAAGLPAGFASVTAAQEAGNNANKEPVISGMRNSSNILIYIDIAKALKSGIKFWKSANGVILSEGNESGQIPIEYFKQVEDRRGLAVIMKDGELKA